MANNNNSVGIPLLAKAALGGRLSRRHFMERALLLGLTVPLASSIWSGQVAATTPRSGGNFRVGVKDANVTDSLDPGTAGALFTIMLNRICRSALTEVTATNALGPDAAESWEASPDAKRWRFKLYGGQEFQNGKSLTAEDVVATLNYHRGPNSKSGARGLLSDVEDVTADGKNTVVITMKLGTADLPYLLADYHLGILPSKGGEVDWESGVGSGPFKLDNFQPGVQATFSRYKNYHGQAYFDAVQMTGINDASARVNALVTNQLDAVSDVDLKTVAMLSRQPEIQLQEVPSGQAVSMDMQCDVAPFDKNDIRLALKYAIDRQEIVKKISGGHATVGNDHPIGPNIPYYAELEQRTFDPERAKYHLKKAGAEGLSVSISTSNAAYDGAVDMCALYAESAAKAGIKLEIVSEAADSYWDNVWLKKPFVVGGYGQRATPDMMFSTFFRDGAPWSTTHWHDDRFQKLLIQAKAELDQKKRSDMYREMQQLCRDESGTILVLFEHFISAHRSNVAHGSSLSSEWQLDGGHAFKRWWFTS